MTALRGGRPGLPRFLDFNEKERWIVTELFPEGTLERHMLKYRGNVASGLRAFRFLVATCLAQSPTMTGTSPLGTMSPLFIFSVSGGTPPWQPPTHCSLAYSAFAAIRMGMSGSASFQSAKKS